MSFFKDIEINGGELLAVKPISAHPADAKLAVVLVRLKRYGGDEYVTWIYNEEYDGFGNGNYFRDFGEALRDFCLRYAPRAVEKQTEIPKGE